MKYDLVLLHAPSVYDFREKSFLAGPISDVVPSSPVFEMYPIGLTSIADYLERFGYRVKIINIANRMLMSPTFDVEKKLRSIQTKAFGISLHWLPHAHGSVALAEVVKRIHPDTPILFGGLSSTYYHKELIAYPFVDFVVRGDSTERINKILMDKIVAGETSFENVPNLTYKKNGEIFANPLTEVPTNMDHLNMPGYEYVVRSVFKYWNVLDPLPYNGWLQYPNTALLTSRGCVYNCLICGGSKDAYEMNCGRKKVAMRSPKKMVEDILTVQRFSRAPIFLLNDIRQGGKAYVDEFLERLGKIKLENELVFELFQYADEAFYEKLEKHIPRYSIEITIESHDEELRRRNGKFNCSNQMVADTLNYALKHNCYKIDLFFMVGIPGQTAENALQNIDFCEELHKQCENSTRLTYFVAPLAPFLDPASPAFENPELHGYKKFCHTLEDHRQAMVQPSWKYMLSYETDSMTRDEIVSSTYESARRLNEFKLRNKLIDHETYKGVLEKIEESLVYIAKIDELMKLPADEREIQLQKFRSEMEKINRHSICGKNELKWEVKKNYANVFTLGYFGLELWIKDILSRFNFLKEKERQKEFV